MDAIIYFYKKRDLTQPKLSLMYRGDYLLAKVGVNADRESWFGQSLPGEPLVERELTEAQAAEKDGGAVSSLRRMLRLLLTWRARRRAARKAEAEKLEFERRRKEMEDNMRQLPLELEKALEDAGGVFELSCVYEDALAFLAEGKGAVSALWGSCWRIPVFQDYTRLRWVTPLLDGVCAANFIFLGASDCAFELLELCSPKMKSLRWILQEQEDSPEIQDFAEDFYEEYGLAITFQFLSGKPFRTLRLASREPVCVLDFTEEKNVSAGELAQGSVWLDFRSIEAKDRRLQRLAPGVCYRSMKKFWSRSERRTVSPVDFS